MPFDKSVWGTPAELQQKVFSKAANGATASSYYPDGKFNLGGWSTYKPQGSDARNDDAPGTSADTSKNKSR